jgi:hypothetical protein
MVVGVQFTGSLDPGTTAQWFTYSWPAEWDVVWTVVPTSPNPGAPEIGWGVAVERASDLDITYWITIQNLTSQRVDIEARYAIMNLS